MTGYRNSGQPDERERMTSVSALCHTIFQKPLFDVTIREAHSMRRLQGQNYGLSLHGRAKLDQKIFKVITDSILIPEAVWHVKKGHSALLGNERCHAPEVLFMEGKIVCSQLSDQKGKSPFVTLHTVNGSKAPAQGLNGNLSRAGTEIKKGTGPIDINQLK
jgi:hypothetical protein